MRIVFFGSGAFGQPTLESLEQEHEVLCTVTQPDRPAGRKRLLTPTPIGQHATTKGMRCIKPESVNEQAIIDELHALNADAWVVIAFGQKLSSALLTDIFAINLHASKLPRWRGAAPINRAILAGDALTGNSVITLADRMDAGLILSQSERPIRHTDTAGQLHDALSCDGPALIQTTLDQYQSGTLTPTVQNEEHVTHAAKLTKPLGYISFDQPTAQVRRLVHGLNPWPSVTIMFRGERVKLHTITETQQHSASEPGLILNAERGDIACSDGSVRVGVVQQAGKPAMAWEVFARGNRIQDGNRFEQFTQENK